MQFRRIPGMTLPMPFAVAEEKMPAVLTPPAAEPVDDEGASDLTPDDEDDTDCAPEGTGQPAVPTVEDRVRVLERALNTVNGDAQKLSLRIEALERAQRRSDEQHATALALEVRALDAAREVA